MTDRTISSTRRMAEAIYRGDLEAFVRAQRAEGKSWERISREVWRSTKGVVDLTGQGLSKWYPDPVDTEAPSGSAA